MSLEAIANTVPYPYSLKRTAEGLALHNLQDKTEDPLFVNFLDKKLQYRLRQNSKNKEQIAKAIGLKNLKAEIKPYVVDATAGLGRDAYILASLGCFVHLIERSPILFLLLKDGLERAAQDLDAQESVSRMRLSFGESKNLLKTNLKPDIIYLDPMYPMRTKSALTKKEMRIVRALVGENQDAAVLLKEALAHAKQRVVVKRPISGLTLVESPPPNFVITGNTNRYDIYLSEHIARK